MNIIFEIIFWVNLFIFIEQNHIVVCKRTSLPPIDSIHDQDKIKADNNSRYLPTDFLLNKPADLPWNIQFNVQTIKPTPGHLYRPIFPVYPPIGQSFTFLSI